MARDYFLAAKRIELQKLARELGISRATAYRWAGSAEQLVGEVVASLIDEAFESLIHETAELKGSQRVSRILRGLLEYTRGLSALQRFLRRNPQQGLKVLTSGEGTVRARTIENIEQLLTIEVDAGNLSLNLPSAFLAYALTRILESYLYLDVIVGAESDDESAIRTIESVLEPGVTR